MTIVNVADTSTARTAAAITLAIAFPAGKPVTVVVRDHRRTRSGTSATSMTVLTTMDGDVADVTGWVGNATGTRTVRQPVVAGITRSELVVLGYGDPVAAAQSVVEDITHVLGTPHALHLI